MIERGSTCRLVAGSEAPTALKPTRRNAAKRDAEDDADDRGDEADEARPRAAPSRPPALPDAPTARSRPSWRVRWATVILNALKMMKLPTKRAIAAKPEQEVAEDVHEAA